MQTANMFLLIGAVIIAPHVTESDAKPISLLCAAIAVAFIMIDLWIKR